MASWARWLRSTTPRVGLAHALQGGVAPVDLGAGPPFGGPGVEGIALQEQVAHRAERAGGCPGLVGQCALGHGVGQAPPEDGVVHPVGLHQAQQRLHPLGVALLWRTQAELGFMRRCSAFRRFPGKV